MKVGEIKKNKEKKIRRNEEIDIQGKRRKVGEMIASERGQ